MSDSENTSSSDPTDAAQTPSASPEQIRVCLDRIVESDGFQGSGRLRELLTYVVTQSLDDPSRKVPAKAIAHDLYGRSLESGSDNVNVVRVDAGRLRRKLGEYYAGAGQSDPVIIHVDPGGYTPRFEVNALSEMTPAPAIADSNEQQRRPIGSATASVALLATFGTGLLVGVWFTPEPEVVEVPIAISGIELFSTEQQLERRALMSKSPSSLQAVTLSHQARNLIFPLIELERLDLTLAMFRQAIKKDDSYFGAYAGAAQSLATMAIFASEGPISDDFLNQAQQMQERAVALAPTDPWTQSASAWTAYANGDIADARKHAEIAIGLSPDNDNILDFHSLLMLCIGDFEAARAAADPDRTRDPLSGPDARQAFFGAASFHLGLYDESISAFRKGIASGAPLSAATLAYLAAAFQAQGDTEEARQQVQDLKRNWPDFRADVTFGRLYADPGQAEAVHDLLLDAGWSAP